MEGMEDSETSDMETVNDLNTSMALGDTTDGEFSDNLMLEEDLGLQPARDDENRRKTRFGGQKRVSLTQDEYFWYNFVIRNLVNSNNCSNIKSISMDLMSTGIPKSRSQINWAIRSIRRHIKMAKGPPKYVETEADKEAFEILTALVMTAPKRNGETPKSNSLQKPKSKPQPTVKPYNRIQKPRTKRPPTMKPSNASAVEARLNKKLDKLSKYLNAKLNEFSNLQKQSKVNEPERTIKFTEGDASSVSEELKPFLSLKNSTITASRTQKYVLENFIGSGTFSVVFRAVDKKNNKAFAMKIVPSEAEAADERSFLNKMEVSGKTRDKYCCFPFDTFDVLHDGKKASCFIMDLLEKDLFAIVFEEKIQCSLHAIVQMMAQAFSALSFINSIGFIHSDLKPENIMMFHYNMREKGDTEELFEPHIKIIDANTMHPIGEPYSDAQTVRYRSPEVMLGNDFDEKIDTWSMGVIATEIITGNFIFDFDYKIYEHAKAAPHVALIEKIIGPFPESLWENCSYEDLKDAMEEEDLKEVMSDEDGPQTLKEILSDVSSEGYGIVLNSVVPSLLKTDPNERPEPKTVAQQLAAFLPIA